MRIGIDARFYGKAGPGRYTKSIVQHLEKVDAENEYIIFLTTEGYKEYQPSNRNFKKVLANHSWYSFDEQTRFLLKVIKLNLDLYYVPHFNIPVLYPGKIITAIPDMTMHKFSTRFSTTLPKWYFVIKKAVYKMVFWWAVFRSYKVIVPSQTVLDEFIKYIKGIPKSKYVLAYEGVDPDYFIKHQNPKEVLSKYGITRPFILYVGSMYEHKNVPGMIDMFRVLKNKYGFTGQFVMAGKKDMFATEIYEKIKADGLENDILLPAFHDTSAPSDKNIVVSDLEVIALRQKALVYVIAAFTEGFSLTALEGMIHGLPAVISDIECHHEVYGDSVLYFDPHSAEDMAKKVYEMLTNKELRDGYIAKGYAQAKKYDWAKTAEITLEVFKKALGLKYL